MTQQEIEEKLARYLKGEGTDEDIAFFESFYIQFNRTPFVTSDSNKLEDVQRAWQHIETSIGTPKSRNWRPWIAAAAISLLLMISAVLSYMYLHQPHPTFTKAYANDVAPGTNRAVLTLSDGRKIALDDEHTGLIAKDENALIRKNKAGEISYDIPSSTTPTALNNMATPLGGTYELKLADGTIAKLDAASSIEYPIAFNGKERKVKISGQVYFDVARDTKKPFIVMFDDNVVEVLGTQFNIKAYHDEPEIKTTLLQGSVLLKSNKAQTLLKPGEQGILRPSDGHLQVVPVNTLNEVSWKEHYFRFDKENIREIMRKLSRWYEIEVVYSGPIPKEEFSGAISRNKNISEVLRMLEYSQSVHFNIEGRRVIVMR